MFVSSQAEITKKLLKLEKEPKGPVSKPKFFKNPLNQIKTKFSFIKSFENFDKTERKPDKKYNKIADKTHQNPSNSSKSHLCNCNKTNCLKLYCECFANGEICDSNCHCNSCSNNDGNVSLRNQVILNIKMKNPFAFENKFKKETPIIKKSNNKGCNCKRSKCQKKYCDCFLAKCFCNENCKCDNCINIDPEKTKKNEIMQNLNEKMCEKFQEKNSEKFDDKNIEKIDEKNSEKFNGKMSEKINEKKYRNFEQEKIDNFDFGETLCKKFKGSFDEELSKKRSSFEEEKRDLRDIFGEKFPDESAEKEN